MVAKPKWKCIKNATFWYMSRLLRFPFCRILIQVAVSINEKRDSIKILTWDPRYFPFRNRCFQISLKGNFSPVSFLKTIAPPKSRGKFLIKAVDDTLQPIFYTSKLPEIRIMMRTHVKNLTVIKWFLSIHLYQVSTANHFELVRLTPRAKPDTSFDPVRTCTHSRESCEKCSIII